MSTNTDNSEGSGVIEESVYIHIYFAYIYMYYTYTCIRMHVIYIYFKISDFFEKSFIFGQLRESRGWPRG